MKLPDAFHMIENALESLRDIPAPDPKRQAAGRKAFLEAARRSRQELTKSKVKAARHKESKRYSMGWIGGYVMKTGRTLAVGSGVAVVVLTIIAMALLTGPKMAEEAGSVSEAQATDIEAQPAAITDHPEIEAGIQDIEGVQPSSRGFVATLVVTDGQQVTVRSVSGLPFTAQPAFSAGEVTTVRAGQTISVEEGTTAQLTFLDGSTVDLYGGTTMTIDELQTLDDGPFRVRLDLAAGRTFHRVQRLLGVGDIYQVSTPSSTASVRGTAFGDEVIDPDTTYVYTEEGVVGVSQDGQEVDVGVGDAVLATDEAPLEVHPHGQVLAGELGVEYEEVMGHFDDGFGFGQIKQVYPLSEELDVTPDRLFEALDAGIGMGVLKQAAEMRKTYGLSFDAFMERYESGMSIGQIKQELDELFADDVKDKDKEDKDKEDKDKEDKDKEDKDKEDKDKKDKKDKKK